jgi:hypothetical protein
MSGSYDPAPDQRGVVVSAPGKFFDGYNLYSSRTGHCAFLVDMKGRLLWRWCAESALDRNAIDPKRWIFLLLTPDGRTLLNVQNRGLYRIDERSRLIGSLEAPTHHDLSVDSHGTIYAPEHRRRSGSPVYDETILDDAVLVADPGGRIVREISLLDLFARSPYAFLFPRTETREFRSEGVLEPFHLNHIEIFDGSLASRSPLFHEGNLLLSTRHNSSVAIVDPREGRVLWAWGPNNVVFQHDPTILKNGNILIFDNGREKSEVVEVDPLTNRVVWKYAPAGGFFSRHMGTAQRLDNGNTLVTESERGYAIEVTPAGEVVWKYANPQVDAKGVRSTILHMRRYPKSALPFLLAHLPDPDRGGAPARPVPAS